MSSDTQLLKTAFPVSFPDTFHRIRNTPWVKFLAPCFVIRMTVGGSDTVYLSNATSQPQELIGDDGSV